MDLTKKEFFEKYAGTYEYDVEEILGRQKGLFELKYGLDIIQTKLYIRRMMEMEKQDVVTLDESFGEKKLGYFWRLEESKVENLKTIDDIDKALSYLRRLRYASKLVKEKINTSFQWSNSCSLYLSNDDRWEYFSDSMMDKVEDRIEELQEERSRREEREKETDERIVERLKKVIKTDQYDRSLLSNYGSEVLGFSWRLIGDNPKKLTVNQAKDAWLYIASVLHINEYLKELKGWRSSGRRLDFQHKRYLSSEWESLYKQIKRQLVEYMENQGQKDWVTNLEPGDVVKFKKRYLTCSIVCLGPYDPADEEQVLRKPGQAEIVKDWVKDDIQFESGYMLDMDTIREFCKKVEKGESK